MLIEDAIEGAKRAGKLVPARAVAPWAGQPRAFLMCKPLAEAIKAGKSHADPEVRHRWAVLEADISHFVEGGRVDENRLKQLEPYKYEHWELRSRRPRPSLRVFGRFAKPDVFVGTHVAERPKLKGKWSPEFEHEKLVCEDHWKEAGLPDAPPPGAFTAPPDFDIKRYVTSNATRRIQVPK